MSDCFNHDLDAFDSLGQDHQDRQIYSKSDYHYDYNPLFYPRKHRVELIHETELAYKFKSSKGVFWVAKRLCKQFKPQKGTVFIWCKVILNYSKE